MKLRARFVVWAVLFLLLCPLVADAQTALPFVTAMQTATKDWRAEIPELQSAAAEAAGRLIAGGNLYVADTQRSFQIELLGRSGGLMMVKVLSDKIALGEQDTILCALDAGTDPAATQALLQRAREAKAKVILFAGPSRGELRSTPETGVFPRRVFTDVPFASAPGVESTSNVIGGWTWIAALVQACVQRGKVPTMFVSGAMPGGSERNAQFRKTPFHTTTQVVPESVRDLPARYLDSLDTGLTAMSATQGAAFERGARLLREASADGHKVLVAYMGHMFPYELTGPGRPNWLVAPKTQVDSTVPAELAEGDVLLFIGYQYFPWQLTSALKEKQMKSVITSSMPPLDDWASDETIAYINPFWAVPDAAVALPGYDVNILPISGVMQSAIYWQLVGLAK